MKALTLIEKKNYPELIVYQESNSFGDQILTFVFENKNGSKIKAYENFCEGNWANFTKKEMLCLWKAVKP